MSRQRVLGPGQMKANPAHIKAVAQSELRVGTDASVTRTYLWAAGTNGVVQNVMIDDATRKVMITVYSPPGANYFHAKGEYWAKSGNVPQLGGSASVRKQHSPGSSRNLFGFGYGGSSNGSYYDYEFNIPLLEGESPYHFEMAGASWTIVPGPNTPFIREPTTDNRSAGHVTGLALIPEAFEDAQFRGGLAIASSMQDAPGYPGVREELNLFAGQPTELSGYARGWYSTGLAFRDQATLSIYSNSYCMAQRKGKYVYFLVTSTSEKTVSHYCYMGRMSKWGNEQWRVVNTDLWRSNDRPWWSISDGQDAQGFVADTPNPDANPRFWLHDGSIVHSQGREHYKISSFIDDGSDLGQSWPWWYMAPEPIDGIYDGQTARSSYYHPAPTQDIWHGPQIYSRHPNFLLMPFLKATFSFALPWANGDYGNPEMWWFVPAAGNRYEIYRARWVTGQWHIFGTPGYRAEAGDSNYQPYAAFEHLPTDPGIAQTAQPWYNPAHLVGSVGPFTDRAGSRQPSAFRIVRDPGVRGRLWLSATGESGWYGNFNNAWLARSNDDGATWTTPEQIGDVPGGAPINYYTPGGVVSPAFVVTNRLLQIINPVLANGVYGSVITSGGAKGIYFSEEPSPSQSGRFLFHWGMGGWGSNPFTGTIELWKRNVATGAVTFQGIDSRTNSTDVSHYYDVGAGHVLHRVRIFGKGSEHTATSELLWDGKDAQNSIMWFAQYGVSEPMGVLNAPNSRRRIAFDEV